MKITVLHLYRWKICDEGWLLPNQQTAYSIGWLDVYQKLIDEFQHLQVRGKNLLKFQFYQTLQSIPYTLAYSKTYFQVVYLNRVPRTKFRTRLTDTGGFDCNLWEYGNIWSSEQRILYRQRVLSTPCHKCVKNNAKILNCFFKHSELRSLSAETCRIIQVGPAK